MKKVYFLVFDTVNGNDEAYIDVNMMKDFECYDFFVSWKTFVLWKPITSVQYAREV